MNLHGLVSIVQESRDLTALAFPLPDVAGCVDYAITEAGEYLDAILRAKRTGDKRNNVKDSDERREWGQCGYMIASAMIQIPNCEMESDCDDSDIYSALQWLCAFQQHPSEIAWQLADSLETWKAVCDANGWDAAELMAETCTAFERKHLPELFEAGA